MKLSEAQWSPANLNANWSSVTQEYKSDTDPRRFWWEQTRFRDPPPNRQNSKKRGKRQKRIFPTWFRLVLPVLFLLHLAGGRENRGRGLATWPQFLTSPPYKTGNLYPLTSIDKRYFLFCNMVSKLLLPRNDCVGEEVRREKVIADIAGVEGKPPIGRAKLTGGSSNLWILNHLKEWEGLGSRTRINESTEEKGCEGYLDTRERIVVIPPSLLILLNRSTIELYVPETFRRPCRRRQQARQGASFQRLWLHSQHLVGGRSRWRRDPPSWRGCCPRNTHGRMSRLDAACHWSLHSAPKLMK